MPRAEFEEKEFEVAAAIELAWGPEGRGAIYSSGQVIENILGYDAAACPSTNHPIWGVLAVSRPPGLRLWPSFWLPGVMPPLARLPSNPVSLILQYKRPTYLHGPAAKQWHRWHRPYFRFERTADQQSVLLRLEKSISDSLLVRYAAPAFWTSGHLQTHQIARTVLISSGYVSPSMLVGHKVWTYERPGTVGYPNPSGRGGQFQSLADILSSMSSASTSLNQVAIFDGFDDHLRRLAQAATEREPTARALVREWVGRISPNQNLGTLTIQRLAYVASIQTVLNRIGATWYMRDAREG